MSEVAGNAADAPSDDRDLSPWARGGAMSDPSRYVTIGPDRLRPGAGSEAAHAAHRDDPAGHPRGVMTHRGIGPTVASESDRLRRVRIGSGVAAAVVVGWIGVSMTTSGSDGNTSPQVSTTVESRHEGVASPAVGDAIGGLVSGKWSDSSVGEIRWQRMDGDRATLPLRVVGVRGPNLVGLDDQGTLALASSDGRRWSRSPQIGVTDVGGVKWVVRGHDEQRVMMQVTESGEQPVAFGDPLAATRDGFAVTYGVPHDAVDGLPLELDGGVFARFDRREEIPWRDVLGVGPDVAYHVEVSVGDQTLTFESSGTAPMLELDVGVETGDETGRAALVDDTDTAIWEFDTGGHEPAAALRSPTTPSWLRWDGHQFVEVDVPWATSDRVEVIAVGDGALAVPTIEIDEPSDGLWWTSNGIGWRAVALPTSRSVRSPMPVHATGDAVVLTISSGDRTSNWSTTDGTSFHELAAVPGIERSSTGTFGLIAPDPRSNPLVRVSPDGQRWEAVDLSDLLDTDHAEWDLTINATAIESTIYVTVTHDQARTLLIGTVATS